MIMRMRTQALPVLALRATHPQEARQFSTTIPRENRLDLQKSSLRLPEEGRKPRGLGNVGRGADKERSLPPVCLRPEAPPTMAPASASDDADAGRRTAVGTTRGRPGRTGTQQEGAPRHERAPQLPRERGAGALPDPVLTATQYGDSGALPFTTSRNTSFYKPPLEGVSSRSVYHNNLRTPDRHLAEPGPEQRLCMLGATEGLHGPKKYSPKAPRQDDYMHLI